LKLIFLIWLQPVGIYKEKYEWAGSHDAGDCSLLIKHVTIEFDDGEWECQVTASEFTAQDALTSTPIKLVVRGKLYQFFIISSYNGNGSWHIHPTGMSYLQNLIQQKLGKKIEKTISLCRGLNSS